MYAVCRINANALHMIHLYCVIQTAENILHCASLNANGQAWYDGKWQAPLPIKGFLRIEQTPCQRQQREERR
jgi:hypothetical protein